jgi:hypothetical protein
MQLTGHKTRSVFDRYDIVDGRDRDLAVEKLAAFHAHNSRVRDTCGTVAPLPLATTGQTHGLHAELDGAQREGRTPTLLREPDFESGASASSAIRAYPL